MKVLKTNRFSEVELGFKKYCERLCKDNVEVQYVISDSDFKRIEKEFGKNLTKPKERLLSRFKDI